MPSRPLALLARAAVPSTHQVPGGDVLTENDIVLAVERHFTARGYTIHQVKQTTEQGTDVVAENAAEAWYVEAKGATSSKHYTRRFGKPFTLNQINSHVSRAVFTAMTVLDDSPAGERTRAALALPDDHGHRAMVGRIAHSLERIGVRILWVRSDGTVLGVA
jgi:hypothetical protein